ncbi:hypothetical protein [Ponticaulis sp.]|uniref:hypothetical protein n=1 Tax=Ponticaulis sp. TaxID=2020902 RepID=UPI000B65F2A2|nr:hypothetical protein [Ponticaulis sp.]MAI89811.1 hypothetical protein [Ponticaulis sp.]OUX99487.1 MAG: hypothetical protein CBB65_05170 [Hyphomonadaceae bacterium TMED5]
MPRDVDEKKTRKALRKLRKAAERAKAEGIELSDWEQEFVEGVDERLTKYGSAFADPSLGNTEDALSNAQSEILRQLDKKSRGKSTGGFKTRKPLGWKKKAEQKSHTGRDIHDDLDEAEDETLPSPPFSGPPKLSVVKPVQTENEAPGVNETPAQAEGDRKRVSPRPTGFTVIEGGRSDTE